MVGPFHDFILLEKDEYNKLGYGGFFHDERRSSISDDLIRYILDTLSWIPSQNPSNEKSWKGYGLNLYGPTLFTSEGGRIASQVFQHWIGLFKLAPPSFQLHSGFVTTSKENGEEVLLPHVIHVEKEECILLFETIVHWAHKVSVDEHYVLLHNGV